MPQNGSLLPPHDPSNCLPIREILSLLGDKWTVVVLSGLGAGRVRFGELQRGIEGISQRMLAVTLRTLERDGMVVRHVYPSVPPRVEYELSERGRSFRKVLDGVAAWIVTERAGIDASRSEYDRLAAETAEASTVTKP